jgi:AraC-like DNA-binding protein
VAHRTVRVENGVLRIEQRLRISARTVAIDVSGPACVLAHVDVARGSVAYRRGTTPIVAPRRFVVFLPPFAIVEAVLEQCTVTSVMYALRPGAPDVVPTEPVLFPVSDVDGASSMDEILALVTDGRDATAVGRTVDPSKLAAETKAIIDAEYGSPLGIGRIANRLRVSPAVLSRAFKSAHGLPPVSYRHQVRIVDALIRFARGEVPVEVFQDVGFDDLGRFYKVFRKLACAAPGVYRPARSRNAKT